MHETSLVHDYEARAVSRTSCILMCHNLVDKMSNYNISFQCISERYSWDLWFVLSWTAVLPITTHVENKLRAVSLPSQFQFPSGLNIKSDLIFNVPNCLLLSQVRLKSVHNMEIQSLKWGWKWSSTANEAARAGLQRNPSLHATDALDLPRSPDTSRVHQAFCVHPSIIILARSKPTPNHVPTNENKKINQKFQQKKKGHFYSNKDSIWPPLNM